MTVTFHIAYKTKWGERLFITGSGAELGHNNIHSAKEMHYYDQDEWRLSVSFVSPPEKIKYSYFVEDENGYRIFENRSFKHHVTAKKESLSYDVYDCWLTEPHDRTLYTSAFTKNIFARYDEKNIKEKIHNLKQTVTIRLYAPQIKPDQVVAITGNQNFLGNWMPEKAKLLSGESFPEWYIEFEADKIALPLEYKFIVLNKHTKHVSYWEEGSNRIVKTKWTESSSEIIISGHLTNTPKTTWKGCGTAVPLFSLRSRKSFGLGDIGDLFHLTDWAKKTGQHLIQVLPLNDTTHSHTWADSYPYSAISIYALHPLYINIPMLGKLKNTPKMAFYNKIQKELNSKESVDYESVEKYKTQYYRDFFKQEKTAILKNTDFKKFIAENKEWLIPYAAFSFLRDKNGTADFSKWGEYAIYNPKKIEPFCNPKNEAYDEFSYLFFIQYTLDLQFKSVSEYARKNNVILKGDIPIGINRTSVEAWTEPGYFNMQGQSGAPPDDFSETGQNWSFPTYNWDIMEKDGFKWWKKRFNKLSRYFDCIRIDHILGFFRIWEIPAENIDGMCGHFRPALPLSKDEILNYGLTFEEKCITPRIHRRFLQEVFGDEFTPQIYNYIEKSEKEYFTLKENCSTQQKIKALFKETTDSETLAIQQGLMNIANEVLFLKDPYNTDCFHPRISAQKSFAYRELSEENKTAFDNLYNEFFFYRHDTFWKETALKRLKPLTDSSEMLICGEDLGMIPATVNEVMKELQICSLELERISKIYGSEFSNLKNLPYHSICSTSTHDMNPIRAWWKEDKERTQRYYNNILEHEGNANKTCSSQIAEQIILRHLQAPSMLTVIPLQDWFAIEDTIKRDDEQAERINIPANPDNNWCYRMHLTLESLLKAENFNAKIRNLVTESNR